MNLKNGVHIELLHPDLEKTLRVGNALWGIVYPEDPDGMNVTGGHEGSPTDAEPAHGLKSKHYIANCPSGKGEAIDLRLNDVKNFRADVFSFILKVIMFMVHDIKINAAPEKIFTSEAHVHIQL